MEAGCTSNPTGLNSEGAGSANMEAGGTSNPTGLNSEGAGSANMEAGCTSNPTGLNSEGAGSANMEAGCTSNPTGLNSEGAGSANMEAGCTSNPTGLNSEGAGSANMEAGCTSNPTGLNSEGAGSANMEAGGTSNPTSSNSEGADPLKVDCDAQSGPVLTPKHDIFMCHSGKQKDFTDLVCRELERFGYTPFFDDRDDSIPKGKDFADLIFRAAEQCRVAILIVSDDFFTNSKWPMTELAAFVDAQKSRKEKGQPELFILPVYDIGWTWEICSGKIEKRSKWVTKWEKFRDLAAEKGDPPFDVRKWELALKALDKAGPTYKQSSRYTGLTDEVVKDVRKLLLPPNMASDRSIRGKKRIRETIMEKISKTTAPSDGARVVGLYGMGGIGKTTFCKELCYQYYKDFEGKVCHAELGSKSKIELQKDVVRTLTNVNHDSLSLLEDSKVTEHLESRMAGEKVFLALDNVWQESREEAMVYVGARYGVGSIVLVTARSIDILKSLKIDEIDCLEMPELEEDDARQLFLDCAAPGFQSQFQSDNDKRSIGYCIKECRFSKGGSRGVHFHPLALKVLGLQLKSVGCNPEKWVESLSNGSKFDLDRQKERPIFTILGKGYDMLREEDQFLFMDVVLFKDEVLSGFETDVNLFDWLNMVHGTDMVEIKNRLQGLKARALLEDVEFGVGRVIVHDLYGEFAIFEANRGKMGDRSVIWHARVDSEGIPADFEKTPPGGPDGCWSNVERVGVHSRFRQRLNVGGVKWQNFANVFVLVLREIEENQVLDLRGLRCLRSLTLKGFNFTVIGLEEVRNLRWLDLEGISCGHHEYGHLTKLQVLWVGTGCWRFNDLHPLEGTQPLKLANLDKCINLRELVVRCDCLEALPNLGQMPSLRRAIFECPDATDGPELGLRMSSLQELQLKCCTSLHRLPRLDEAVSLQVLRINNPSGKNHRVKQFPEIGTLTSLRELEIGGFGKLSQLPELGELVALEELVIERLPRVRQLPNMVMLEKLQRIELNHIHVTEWVGLLPPQLQYRSEYDPIIRNIFYDFEGHGDSETECDSNVTIIGVLHRAKCKEIQSII